MAGKTYRLKIIRDGQELEIEGDKAFVLEMLKRFAPQGTTEAQLPANAKSPRGQPRKSDTTPIPKGKPVSIREFIQQVGLKKHTEITLAFGFYLERYSGISEFTPADINNCYYEAKMESSNTSQMLIQNIRRGFLMESKKTSDKGRKRYILTSSGEKFIESKLTGNS